jgi:fructose 1,6-bisphosphatase
MPENQPSFVLIKGWILAAAAETGTVMSVRRAKKLAGDYLAKNDPEAYRRQAYADPVGEGVARRWMDFKHNLAAAK